MMIHEVAKLTRVTVRTLQYYDQIGLLRPSEVLENGYRNYHPEDLELLQQILFFRELGFPLSQIKEIMNSPNYDKERALQHHMELLIKKREDLDSLIHLVESRIKGEEFMDFKAFDHSEYESKKEEYAKEVKERWGKTKAYQEYEEKETTHDKSSTALFAKEVDEILERFAKKRDLSPENDEVQSLVREWQNYITKNFYTCTNEILAGLGLMYVGDDRFKTNIDQHGEGTAEFLSKAIEYYCKK